MKGGIIKLMGGKSWHGFAIFWLAVLGLMWFFLHGCAHYEAYPKGQPPHKESKIQQVTPADVRWEKVDIHYTVEDK